MSWVCARYFVIIQDFGTECHHFPINMCKCISLEMIFFVQHMLFNRESQDRVCNGLVGPLWSISWLEVKILPLKVNQ